MTHHHLIFYNHRCRIRLDLVALTLCAALACPVSSLAENYECSPGAYPVKNFARQIGVVQKDAREVLELIRGPERRFLDVNLPADLARLRNAPQVPRLYFDKPVATFLQEVLSKSTIFTWENNGLNSGRGTAAVIGDVENDLIKQRAKVLANSNGFVAMLRSTIADSDKVSEFFDSTIGPLVRLRNESDEVRDQYMNKAFDHLNSCLASCAGPKGFNLSGFRSRFAEMYAGSSNNTFAASSKDLSDARSAVENLIKELNADISPKQTDSLNTTGIGALEAETLQKAANLLGEARKGGWGSVGSNNEKINQAIGPLSTHFGYQGNTGRPDPVQLISSAIDKARTAQASIDKFLGAHTRLVDDLQAFLKQYEVTYQRGCRAN